MPYDLLNLALRPSQLKLRKGVGLVLTGSVDQVRQAASRWKFLPVKGAELIGYGIPKDPSCTFLANMPALRHVRLFAGPLANIESLQSLKSLRSLVIQHVAERQVIGLDLSAFPALENINLEWFQGAETIFRGQTARTVSLMHFPNSTSECFRELHGLSRLRLADCELSEITTLQSRRSLQWLALLRQEKLADFSGLSHHPSLRFVWIEGCSKLRTLDWLKGMQSLETVRILDCGQLSGIEVLRTLPRLRHVHIHGCANVVARDLPLLSDLPSLESVVLEEIPEREGAYWKRRNKKYDLLRSDIAP